ncbi:MAG: YifB family Mg chelatase-like AAA ATPase [Rickettsiales bacterium]|jgi:magnesium chelatase family protein|nr:YifB family Mg chelatase-like AAA ATPase [Rickettsiales bacterium]
MVAKIKTFTFIGVEAVDVSVEVKLASGIVVFNIVGLPDKAVNEAKERIRASINSINLSFPAQRLTINLSPADLNKEGSYLDLPMALGLLVEMNVIKQSSVDGYAALGELSLDGNINAVNGILPAAIGASGRGLGIICPKSCGGEALMADRNLKIIATSNLLELINHLNGKIEMERPTATERKISANYLDFRDVYGQRLARKGAEIAAAGGHNMLMVGPPGTGKSMIAERILGILPELSKEEMLEINVINSIAGKIRGGEFLTRRPFRCPHHSCSMPAMVGGGSRPKPGEITLAHNGILFLDELPEFSSQVLDSLRQPLETGKVSIARAMQHITYPADFQLIAAMNPCKCGRFGISGECRNVPKCAQTYQNKISGPLLDRFDLFVNVDVIDIIEEKNNSLPPESSDKIRERVQLARNIQLERYKNMAGKKVNSKANGESMNKFMKIDGRMEKILQMAAQKYRLSSRGYNKVIKVARTIADLENEPNIREEHLTKAILFKQTDYLTRR